MHSVTVGIRVKVAIWFKVLLWALPLLAKLRLMEIETAAKIICKASEFAFRYKIDKGKWKDMNLKLDYELQDGGS